MTHNVLIIGAQGMLGQALVAAFGEDEAYHVTAWDRAEIDVTDTPAAREKITALWPDIIINATAYNAVDACEEDDAEYAKAQALNTRVPGELAKIAASLQATFVHYSTDYVFDGQRPRVNGRRGPGCCGQKCQKCRYMGPEENFPYWPYCENDDANPLSRYGQTKRDGERAVEKYGSRYYIIRLSKLFGAPATAPGAKRSFFDVMRDVGVKAQRDGTCVTAVDGETSCFTYAPDLAVETKAIIEDAAPSGIYHVVNSGPCTWYEAAKTLYEILGMDVCVKPVPPSAFPRPAQRPASSVLISTKRSPLRDYREALREYLVQTRA